MGTIERREWPKSAACTRFAQTPLFATRASARDLIAAGRDRSLADPCEFRSTLVPGPSPTWSPAFHPAPSPAVPATAVPGNQPAFRNRSLLRVELVFHNALTVAWRIHRFENRQLLRERSLPACLTAVTHR